MKNWSIKERVLFVALLPTILITLSLASYFNYTQITNLERSLHERGELIAKQISTASEYGIFTSNTEILDHLSTQIINEIQDIVEINISDINGEILIIKKNPHSHNKTSDHESLINYLASQFITEDNISFYSTITTTEIEIDDYPEQSSKTTESSDSDVIGHIKLTLTNHLTREEQLVSLLKGITIPITGLILTIFFAIRISAGVISPIIKLTKAVNDIADNKLDAQLAIDSGGEIGSLERGFNKMSNEIRSSRKTLEKKIEQATSSLTKTLDELEIQNIELDIARNHALSASKIKSEFLANMSHEIRTPMNGVIGFTDLLSKTKINDQQKDYIRTIENSARNLLTIIDDILDFSKIESGKLRIEDISFDITEVMNDIATMFTPLAYNKNIEIISHPLSDKIPSLLIGDPTRLRQIIVNLVSNAIKFTENGLVSIRTKILEKTDDNINILFTIKDTGIGLNEESKQQLFKAFTQADNSISRRFGGTGLGLVICKNLIELMRGDIGFDSDTSTGSRFWFSIKFTTPEIQIHHETLTINNGKTALVYEELNEAMEATTIILKEMGLNIFTTQDHKLIPEIINNNKIDFLVLGINRTNIKNTELLDEISNLTNKIDNHLVIASTFSNIELQSILDTGIRNVIFRSSPKSLIKKKIHNIVCGLNEENQSENILKKTESSRDFSHVKALIVDDNEINLKLAHTILNNTSMQVTTANNGQDALDLCLLEYFDIILMDLHMPVMNGFKTIENLRSTINYCTKSIIIALTANATPEDKLKAFNAGVNDILIKPFNENQIFSILDHWLPYSKKPQHTATITSQSELPGCQLYNHKTAVTLAGGSEQLAYELLTMLIADLPNHKLKIEQAHKLNNTEELRQAVHKLHGGAKYCAAEELSSSAGKVENMIIKNNIADINLELNNLYEKIDNLISYYHNNKQRNSLK
ncbi:MAG: ATP-binding protein [Gammaproteobacteria bacterium]|nr:ATP-binding protein [Gammaproteobacteria bacterium]